MNCLPNLTCWIKRQNTKSTKKSQQQITPNPPTYLSVILQRKELSSIQIPEILHNRIDPNLSLFLFSSVAAKSGVGWFSSIGTRSAPGRRLSAHISNRKHQTQLQSNTAHTYWAKLLGRILAKTCKFSCPQRGSDWDKPKIAVLHLNFSS